LKGDNPLQILRHHRLRPGYRRRRELAEFGHFGIDMLNALLQRDFRIRHAGRRHRGGDSKTGVGT